MPDEHQHIIHTIRFELITDDRGFALQMQDMVSEAMHVDLVLALNQVLSNHAIPGRHLKFDKVVVELKDIRPSQFKIELLRQVPVNLSRQLDDLITKHNYSQLPPIEITDTEQNTYIVNTLAKYLETGIWSVDTAESKPEPRTVLIQMMEKQPEVLKILLTRMQSNPRKTVPRLAALLSQTDLKKLIKSTASQMQETIYKNLTESLFETIRELGKIARISQERWEEVAKKTIVSRFVTSFSRQAEPLALAREITTQWLEEFRLPGYVVQIDKSGKIKVSPMLVRAAAKKKDKVTVEQLIKEIKGLVSKDEMAQLNVDWPPDGFTAYALDDVQKELKKKERFKSEKQVMEEIQQRIKDQAAIAEILKKAAEQAESADVVSATEDVSIPESETKVTSEDTGQAVLQLKPDVKPPDISGALFRYLTGGSPWWDLPVTKVQSGSEEIPAPDLMRVSPNQIIGLFRWLRKTNQTIARQLQNDPTVEAILEIRAGALVARLMSGITAGTAENLLAELYPGQQRLIHYLELGIQYLTEPLSGIIKQQTAQPLKQLLLTQFIEGKKSITNLKEARAQIYKAVDALIPGDLLLPFLQALARFGPGRDLEERSIIKGKPGFKIIEIPVLRKFADEWPTAIIPITHHLSPEAVIADFRQAKQIRLTEDMEDVSKIYSTSMLNQLAQFIRQSDPELFTKEIGPDKLQKLILKLSEPEKFDPGSITESEAKAVFSFLAAIMPDKFVKTGLEVMFRKEQVPDADTLTDALNRVFTAATSAAQQTQQDPLKRKVKAAEEPAEVQLEISDEQKQQIPPDDKIPKEDKAVKDILESADESKAAEVKLPDDKKPVDEFTADKTADKSESFDKSEPEQAAKRADSDPKTAIPKEKHTKDDTPVEKEKIEEIPKEHPTADAFPEDQIADAAAVSAEKETGKATPPKAEVPPLTPDIQVQDEVWTEMVTRMREGVWALKLLEKSYEIPMKTLDDLTDDMARALFLVYLGDGKIPPELLLEGVPVEKPAIVAWLNKIITQKPAWLYKLLVQTIGNPAAIQRLTEVLDEKSMDSLFEFLSSKQPAILPWISEMRAQSKNWFESSKDKTLMLKTLAAIAIKPSLDVENVYLYFLRLHLKLAEKEFGKTAASWLEFWQKSAPEITLQPEKFSAALKLMEQQIDNRKARPDFSKYFDMDSGRSESAVFTEKVMVNNAGIVLLNPFLPQLFKVTELLDEKRQFKSPQHVWQAIQMLHYAVTKQKNTPEHATLLSKIICGMEPDWLPPDENSFDEKHIPLIESMLQALINQWTALGKSSTDNLRGSFLFRSGLLFDEGNRWTLNVEQKPWDILVEKIPWTIGLIKLPWMKKRIQVTWR